MSHMITFLSSEQLLELHRGQGKDIYWRDSFICPTEEEYMEMVRQSKLLATPTYPALICTMLHCTLVAIETGGLFALAVDLMQLFSDNSRSALRWSLSGLAEITFRFTYIRVPPSSYTLHCVIV